MERFDGETKLSLAVERLKKLESSLHYLPQQSLHFEIPTECDSEISLSLSLSVTKQISRACGARDRSLIGHPRDVGRGPAFSQVLFVSSLRPAMVLVDKCRVSFIMRTGIV